MDGGTRLDPRYAPDDAPDDGAEDALLLEDSFEALPPAEAFAPDPLAPLDPTPAVRRRRWVVPLLASLAALAWLGTAVALLRPVPIAALTAIEQVELVGALCVPLALIALVWLIAQRNSRVEARGFADIAATMRAEAQALEASLARVAAQLADGQQRLAAQNAALQAMGDQAAARLTATSDGMAEQIARADTQARQLSEAVTGAERQLAGLLEALPRAGATAQTITQAIDASAAAADAASGQLAERFAQLGAEARASEAAAHGALERLSANSEALDAMVTQAVTRLEGATDASAQRVTGLLGQTADAVDQARAGIAAQGEAMLQLLSAHQSGLERAGHDAIDALAARIAEVDAVVDRMAARLAEQRRAGDALATDLDRQFQVIEARVGDFHRNAIERNQTLAASISALGGSAEAMGETLQIGEQLARNTIKTSEDLLIALDAAAREIDETLPEALARLDTRVAASRQAVSAAKPELLALVTAAESTHDAIEAIAQVIQGQRRTLDELSRLLNDALAQGRERAEAIGEALDETIGRTQDFTGQAAPRLMEALVKVRDSAAIAADRARETLGAVIPEAAALIENASTQAMQRALGQSFERHLQELSHAADSAVGAAQRASDRLAEQLLTIEGAAREVDARIEQARVERDQAETESFGRRSSVLIEALNSAAIDIAKAFSAEVTDSAWAAYLKGDRGVFTRRAVRLLEAGEAREVARLYDLDAGFRDQVNRYIHDFEAMLRVVLAQRDGAPIGVTLLSSDMGKLYVALAQAIERLRT
ncbi:MAG: hypothetical protein K2X73_06585 [Sphingomonas sp.]|uniref:hypothetical protein n=1 Tax=Sphingomonas sp. TaxID=28214 RepID=UPI0025E3C056|nr:hypothetical protein [Sphingomonas sp.]MBX9881625.1 hypothetical protein [Sphingomonas sp.]